VAKVLFSSLEWAACHKQLEKFYHQARRQGGFEGVRTNPLVAKPNLFLTRQQQYGVQSFNRAVVLLKTAYKPSCSCYKG